MSSRNLIISAVIVLVAIVGGILLVRNFQIKGAPLLPSFDYSVGSYGSSDNQFQFPVGVAVDQSNNFYVTDLQNNRIQKYSASGTLIEMWGYGVFDGTEVLQKCVSNCLPGISGTNKGQFNSPTDIAVDSSTGYVYITDTSNHRIQRFNPNWASLDDVLEWGSLGAGEGQFNSPKGISVDSSGNVYVADAINARVQKFDANGIFITGWGRYGVGDGEFSGAPLGVAVDGGGSFVYVFTGDDRIQKFTSSGDFIGWAGKCTNGSGCDLVIQKSNGFSCTTTTCEGLGSGVAGGTFNNASQGLIYVDSSGYIYVSDSSNNRIQQLDSDGNFVTSWGWGVVTGGDAFEVCTDAASCAVGLRGSGNGQFFSPIGLAVDSDGNVYIADTSNHRIQKFNFISPPDTTPPTRPDPFTPSFDDVNTVTLNWGVSTDDVGLDHYSLDRCVTNIGVVECDTEFSNMTPFVNPDVTSFVDPNFIDRGFIYHYRIIAYDAAGNKSDSLLTSIEIASGGGGGGGGGDVTLPVIGVVSPNSATADQEVTISANYSDDVGVRYCNLFSDTFVPFFNGTKVPMLVSAPDAVSGTASYTVTFTASDAGSYNFHVECSDTSKNIGVGESSSFVISATVSDTDKDKVEDGKDNCPLVPNSKQEDKDTDGVGDTCDNCPNDINGKQTDSDGDGIGDACDGDVPPPPPPPAAAGIHGMVFNTGRAMTPEEIKTMLNSLSEQ